MLRFKINITKRLLVHLLLLVTVVGSAVWLDVYYGSNIIELEEISAESQKQSAEPGEVYLTLQNSSSTVKSSVQKTSNRKMQFQTHDKFLRRYHQIRNYQVLKAEAVSQTAPLIQSYHYLVFQNYFFTQPDEEPVA